MNKYDASIQDSVQGCSLQILIFLVVEDFGEMSLKYIRSWRKNYIRNSFQKNCRVDFEKPQID